MGAMATLSTTPSEPETPRPVPLSLARGFRGRCPNCGEGRLFGRYLKPVAQCAVCGEDYTHQRADDGPAYFTMVIAGHLLVPLMLTIMLLTNLSTTANLIIWLPTIGIITVGLLQPVKGATIALQWALRMHGFDGKGDDVEFIPEGALDFRDAKFSVRANLRRPHP